VDLRIPVIFICFVILAFAPDVSAQTVKRIPLATEMELLDVISVDEQIHLVTKEGIYNFNNLIPEQVVHFADKTLTKPYQNYSRKDGVFCYPLAMGDYACFNSNTMLTDFRSGRKDKGIFLKRKRDKLFINSSAYLSNGRHWRMAKPLNDYSHFADGQLFRDKAYLANKEDGVYILNERLEPEVLTTKDGLESNRCTAITVCGDRDFYVGHKGSVTRIKGKEIKTFDLIPYIGPHAVCEMEVVKERKVWGITYNKLFSITDDKVQVHNLDLLPGELLMAIHISKDDNVWVLSDRAMYLLPCEILPKMSLATSKTEEPAEIYDIRGNTYYSNGVSVYKYRPESQSWQRERRRKAPIKVIPDYEGHPLLILKDNKGVHIHKVNANLLSEMTFTEDQVENVQLVNSSKLISTATSLYQRVGNEFKVLNEAEDHFYKVIATDFGHYAFAQSGVYKILSEAATPLLSTFNNFQYSTSKNQFYADEKVVTFTASGIQLIDAKNESLDVINVTPLKILDILEGETVVWLLTTKSILAINKAKMLDGKLEVVKTLPLYDNLPNGRLERREGDELWAVGSDKIFKVKSSTAVGGVQPRLRLHKIINASGRSIYTDKEKVSVPFSELPLTLVYKSSSYWTDNIRYAFHVNHDGKNISEWTTKPTYILDGEEGGKYTVNAKYKDDIYGVNIQAPTLTIEVKESAIVEAGASRYFLIPISLISLLILGLVGSLYRKKAV